MRFVLTPVAVEEPGAAGNEQWQFGSVLLDAGALSDAQLREAAELLGHLNEAWFGYRSGDPDRRSPGEPRPGFDPAQTTLGKRLEAKAAELGCSVWKLYKKRRSLSVGASRRWLTDAQRNRRSVRRSTLGCGRRSSRRRRVGGVLGCAQDAVSRPGREPLGAGERRAA